jgi:hypothetical protein
MKKSKSTDTTETRFKTLKRIAAKPSQVDAASVKQILDLLDYINSVGVKSKGFNILRSSESRLRAIDIITKILLNSN